MSIAKIYSEGININRYKLRRFYEKDLYLSFIYCDVFYN